VADSTPNRPDPASAFARQINAPDIDLGWSLTKACQRAIDAGITDPTQVATDLRDLIPSKISWAEHDGDEQRAAKWRCLGTLIDADPERFRAYIRTRLEWLAKTPDERQQIIEANRKPVSAKQIALLARLGADISTVSDSWQASRLIGRLLRERA
jgi:hypothetical protein